MRSAPYDVVLSGAALALRPPRGTAVRSAPAAAAAVSASGAPPISYRNKTLYVFIIILSFQVLFPRLLRKCGIKGHVMFARRFIRPATKFCHAELAVILPGLCMHLSSYCPFRLCFRVCSANAAWRYPSGLFAVRPVRL